MRLPIKIDLPDGFLDEEIRCNYTVSKKMKAVWAVELDLYKELERICIKHNIRLFADGGTMLGCVRHQGFIPWDDDIDIAMFREDYEKFRKIAPEECQYPYFFQDEYTDRGTLLGHGQLKNSNTSYINPALPIISNQGIYIDIFPLDSVPDDPLEFQKLRKKLDNYKTHIGRISSITDCYNPQKSGIINRIKGILHYFSPIILKIKDYHDLYIEFEECCQTYNNQETEFISLLSFNHGWDRLIRKRTDYKTFVPMKYEFIDIPVIKNFDDTLRRLYGDYHKMIIGSAAHENLIVDPYNPYTKYIGGREK